MPYSSARKAAENKVEAAVNAMTPEGAVLVGDYEVSDKEPSPKPKQREQTDYDDDTVRKFIVMLGLRKPDDDSPPTPPEYRLFNSQYPSYLAQKKREAEERARSEARSREVAAAAEKARQHAWRMRDMREWGRDNGYFVGTRGRIPRKVIEAYKEAKGL
ncbi:Lsr2 family DNA-binding protein [Streptomyces sp. NPDC001118]|uniref:Lsr2 family DNA-binding protein n=1 Tax=Streptomyces sp. NPDC001127 TaxID=3154377 RepID=UPI003323A8AE